MSQEMDVSEFSAIPGYRGYMVSKNGVVISSRLNSKRGKIGFSIINQRTDRNGYKKVNIFNDQNKKYTRFVHYLVLLTYAGERPIINGERFQCCHSDGNKENNSIENLRWGTCSENQKDNVIHGVTKTGISEVGLSYISLWNSCETVEEVCKKTGKSPRKAVSLASHYRSLGHQMKSMRRIIKKIAMPGERFGKWLVIGFSKGCVRKCVCDCGVIRDVFGPSMTTGVSISCGCSRKAPS